MPWRAGHLRLRTPKWLARRRERLRRGGRWVGHRGPGDGGWARIRGRPGSGRPAGLALLRSDGEGQPGSLGVSDVDALAVVQVDDRHSIAVDVGPVQRPVVDCQPAALVEAQDQVRTGYPRVGDAQIGVLIASDDHFLACGEGSLRPVVPNRQDRRGGSIHYSSIGAPSQCLPLDWPVTSLCLLRRLHSWLIAFNGLSPIRVRQDARRGVVPTRARMLTDEGAITHGRAEAPDPAPRQRQAAAD